jgi:hypothetical protein
MMKGKAETHLQIRVRVTPSQAVLPADEEFAADEEWSQFPDETQQSQLADAPANNSSSCERSSITRVLSLQLPQKEHICATNRARYWMELPGLVGTQSLQEIQQKIEILS